MFGFYISLPFLLFALYRLYIVLYNYYTRPFLPTGKPIDLPLISVIVAEPYDNNSTKNLLNGLLNQTYQNIEVLIYVDNENTQSIEILREYSSKDKRLRLVEGVNIPEGWVKRNYINDLLSQQSKGQYIIFLEFDVYIGNEVVVNTLSYMQLYGLSLLTVFPKQIAGNHKNRLFDSIRSWLLLTLCSLKRIRNSKKVSISATANQLMMFESTSYKTYRWHEKYKGSEDVDFVVGRFVKNSGLLMASLLSNDEIMVESTRSDFDSTASFIFNFFGRNTKRLLIYTIASTFGLVLAIFLLPFPLVFLYLFAIFYARMLFATISGRSPLFTLLLLPIHHFVFLYLVIKLIKAKSGK